MKCDPRFHSRIPRGLSENLQWRKKVQQRVLDDPSYADAIEQMCAKDPIFFCTGFCYTHDTRCEPFTKLPFILYPFQEDALLEIVSAMGSYDLFIEKSRDMGVSWICTTAIYWMWRFCSQSRMALLVSSKAVNVDESGNPKSLFWKYDYLNDNLPTWLQPNGYKRSMHRRLMHMENPDNGCVTDGDTTQEDIARGDRRYVQLLDEFAMVKEGRQVLASTRDAGPCRIFNSTPKGTGNAFYGIRQTNIKKLRLHWSEHPVKRVGLYTTDDAGFLKVLDPEGYPEDYEPILDGKLRSPWYDGECERAESLQEIAQELDIDYLGSGSQFFSAKTIAETIKLYARQPDLVGDLAFDATSAEVLEFRDNIKGNLRLWTVLGADRKPPTGHSYVVACDISSGTGASNSCASIWDMTIKEKVGEYVNPYIRPEAFAAQSVAFAKWFGNALLAWEANGGSGQNFGAVVLELGYDNIYYRKAKDIVGGKITTIPGWWSGKETKETLLGTYRSAIEKLTCVNRSQEALQEAMEYVYTQSGAPEHVKENDKSDPSGARANHGDRVIADALAWSCIEDGNVLSLIKDPDIPFGSLAWRRQRYDDIDSLKSKDGWDV